MEPINRKCQWNGCSGPGARSVFGEMFCPSHEDARLLQRVKDGAAEGFTNEHLPDPLWLNCFGRLIERSPLAQDNALRKRKIQDRAYDFVAAADAAWFSINRDPAAITYEQRWRYDLQSQDLELTSQRVLKTDLITKGDSFLCPACGSKELEIWPGRVRCYSCRWEKLHEHTRV